MHTFLLILKIVGITLGAVAALVVVAADHAGASARRAGAIGPRPPTRAAGRRRRAGKVCEFVGYALKADPLLRISAGEKPVELPAYPECQKRN
jgi:hypothetical protein